MTVRKLIAAAVFALGLAGGGSAQMLPPQAVVPSTRAVWGGHVAYPATVGIPAHIGHRYTPALAPPGFNTGYTNVNRAFGPPAARRLFRR